MSDTEQSVLEAMQEDAQDLGRARGRHELTDRLYDSATSTRVAQLAYEKETGKVWMNLSVNDQDHWRENAQLWIACVGQALMDSDDSDDDDDNDVG